MSELFFMLHLDPISDMLFFWRGGGAARHAEKLGF